MFDLKNDKLSDGKFEMYVNVIYFLKVFRYLHEGARQFLIK